MRFLFAAALGLSACAVWVPEPTPPPAPRGALPRDKSAPLVYAALGDSTVFGIGASLLETTYPGRLQARLAEHYPRASLQLIGTPGATSADVVEHQVPEALALRPQLVTLSIGPNDITQGRTVAQFDQAIAGILEAFGGESDILVVLTLIPDMTATRRFSDEEEPLIESQVAGFNWVLAQRAAEFGAVAVDIYTPSRDLAPEHPEWLSSDGYHPSDEGYARWAEVMWPAIAERIP